MHSRSVPKHMAEEDVRNGSWLLRVAYALAALAVVAFIVLYFMGFFKDVDWRVLLV